MAAGRYCTGSASRGAVRSEAGPARCTVGSASMDPVPDSEAESVRRSADSASTDPARYFVVDSADPAVPDLDPAERFRCFLVHIFIFR